MDKNKLMRLKEKVAQTLKAADDYTKTPEGRAYQRRLGFATFILKELKKRELSQREFAARIGMKPEQLNRVVRAEANFTVETWSRVVDGLGYMEASPIPAQALDSGECCFTGSFTMGRGNISVYSINRRDTQTENNFCSTSEFFSRDSFVSTHGAA